MAIPTYQDLITLSSTANGLKSETIDERILTILSILASNQNPDGTSPGGLSNAFAPLDSAGLVEAPARQNGLAMFIRGASFDISPGIRCTPGNEWFNLLKTWGYITGVTTSALGSTRLVEQNFAAITNVAFNGIPASALWPQTSVGGYSVGIPGTVPGQPGLQVIGSIANEYVNTSVDRSPVPEAISAGQLNAIEAGLNAQLTLVCSTTRFEEPSSSSGWSETANPASPMGYAWSGGDVLSTTTPGATMNIAVTVPASGKMYALTYAIQGASLTPGNLSWSIGGTVYGAATFTGSGSLTYASLYSAQSLSPAPAAGYGVQPVMVLLSGMPPGAQTITVTKTDAGGGAVYADAIFSANPAPPPVIVMDGPALNLSVSAPPLTAPQAAIYEANKAIVDPAFQAICASYPNAIWLDIGSILAPFDLSSIDGLHPNDSGMPKIARAVIKALNVWLAANNPAGLYDTL